TRLAETSPKLRRHLAGAGGFEPPNGGIKIRCLTRVPASPTILKLKKKLTFGHPQNGHFYVAHFARFSQVISAAPNERRRLHATWMRHTAVSSPITPRQRPHLPCPPNPGHKEREKFTD